MSATERERKNRPPHPHYASRRESGQAVAVGFNSHSWCMCAEKGKEGIYTTTTHVGANCVQLLEGRNGGQ